MTNEPKKCGICGLDLVLGFHFKPDPTMKVEDGIRFEKGTCPGHPQVAKEEGWERRLREILIGEVWATNNFSSPEEAIKELVRQEKAASRKEGYSAALDEAIEVFERTVFKVRDEAGEKGWDWQIHLEALESDLASSLNALKGKGLNAKDK